MNEYLDAKEVKVRRILIVAIVGIIFALLSAALFAVLIASISEYILPLLKLDSGVLEISLSELLAFFGAAAGIVFSAWTYISSQNEKAEEEAKRYLEYKPQFSLHVKTSEACLEMTIVNQGPKNYKYICYCNYGCIAPSIFCGQKISTIILKCDSEEDPEDYLPSKVIVDSDWYGEPCQPSYFFITCFDDMDRPWMLSYQLNKENGEYELDIING